jgi:predicted DNA-binding transcriptional regulator YafY
MDDQLKRQEMRVSIAEAAERLRLSEQTVRRRVRSGELPGVQLNTPQGFIWMVELSDDLSTDNPDSGEIKALRELIDTLRAQIETLSAELEGRRREAQEFLFLLQQAQVALPAPRDNRSWWRFWQR